MEPKDFFDDINAEVVEPEKFVITEDMVFIFGDVETTGLSPEKERMTEIALIRTDFKFNIVDSYIASMNPERPISAFITGLTGITEASVLDKPVYEEAIPAIGNYWYNKDFMGKRIIFVAHNAPFDNSFINKGFQDILEEDLIVEWIDTVSLARELYPYWKNHKLDTCAEKFGVVNNEHHRAENDTKVLLNIGIRLIQEFTAEGLNPINFRSNKSLHYKK